MARYETVSLAFDGKNWKAERIEGILATKKVLVTSIEPTGGFDSVLTALTRNNIFQLGNQDKLSLKGSADDGTDYTLTFKKSDTCRTYGFNNPEFYKEWNKNLEALDSRLATGWQTEVQQMTVFIESRFFKFWQNLAIYSHALPNR